MQREVSRRSWAARILTRALYWLAVVTISLALVFLLLLFFESRDESSVDGAESSARQDRPL